MLKYIIYYASYFFMAYVVWGLVKGKNRPAGDVLFLVGVALVPLGKLFYIPFTGLVSVTAAFIFTTIIGGGTLLVSFIKGVPRYVFVPFMSIIPALLSIIFLYAPSQSMFVQASANAASAGSPLLRIVSIFFTSVYCAWVVIYVSQRKNGYKLLAKYYVMGTLFATLVGVFIAYGIFFGILDKPDLMPVAVEDIHMAGRIYRFNPGASVNEFGEIIGYAIFMLRWTGWTTTRKMVAAIVLILALFFSLTRGAWLGMVVGYLAYAAFSSRAQRKNILLAAAGVIVVLLAVVLSSDELTFLLVSRTSFGYSPGSDDRLNTASAVFDAITRTPVRMLFGYGWAADIFSPNYGFDRIGYIHSVPLMFLFDTGAVGVAFCCAIFFAFGRFAYANIRKDLDIYAGLIVFMFIVSTVEHIFFHVQTWLIFGLLIGLAFKAAEERKQELAARLSQARTS
jgi:hypothetical protein